MQLVLLDYNTNQSELKQQLKIPNAKTIIRHSTEVGQFSEKRDHRMELQIKRSQIPFNQKTSFSKRKTNNVSTARRIIAVTQIGL